MMLVIITVILMLIKRGRMYFVCGDYGDGGF